MAVEWVAFLLGLLQGAILIRVAAVVSGRTLQGAGAVANRFFAAWWWLIGAIVLLRAAVVVVQAIWGPLLALQVAYVDLVIIMVTTGAWALTSYLAFIFTGSLRSWRPLAIGYAILLAALFFVVAYAQPVGVQGDQWQVDLQYQNELRGIAAVQWILVLLFLPPLLGAIAYASLLLRVRARPQRFRIAMVSSALTLWLGSSIGAVVLGWSRFEMWTVLGRLIGLVASVLVLIAYRPPAWLARRFGENE